MPAPSPGGTTGRSTVRGTSAGGSRRSARESTGPSRDDCGRLPRRVRRSAGSGRGRLARAAGPVRGTRPLRTGSPVRTRGGASGGRLRFRAGGPCAVPGRAWGQGPVFRASVRGRVSRSRGPRPRGRRGPPGRVRAEADGVVGPVDGMRVRPRPEPPPGGAAGGRTPAGSRHGRQDARFPPPSNPLAGGHGRRGPRRPARPPARPAPSAGHRPGPAARPSDPAERGPRPRRLVLQAVLERAHAAQDDAAAGSALAPAAERAAALVGLELEEAIARQNADRLPGHDVTVLLQELVATVHPAAAEGGCSAGPAPYAVRWRVCCAATSRQPRPQSGTWGLRRRPRRGPSRRPGGLRRTAAGPHRPRPRRGGRRGRPPAGRAAAGVAPDRPGRHAPACPPARRAPGRAPPTPRARAPSRTRAPRSLQHGGAKEWWDRAVEATLRLLVGCPIPEGARLVALVFTDCPSERAADLQQRARAALGPAPTAAEVEQGSACRHRAGRWQPGAARVLAAGMGPVPDLVGATAGRFRPAARRGPAACSRPGHPTRAPPSTWCRSSAPSPRRRRSCWSWPSRPARSKPPCWPPPRTPAPTGTRSPYTASSRPVRPPGPPMPRRAHRPRPGGARRALPRGRRERRAPTRRPAGRPGTGGAGCPHAAPHPARPRTRPPPLSCPQTRRCSTC